MKILNSSLFYCFDTIFGPMLVTVPAPIVKTMSLGIDTYIADADLTKTHDNTVRIYKTKKVNIDYDYKKYGPIGTDFEIVNS